MKRSKDTDPEEAMKQIQKIFQKRGTKALEIARKEILQEKIECKEAREALTYFITEYWHDLARPTLLSLVCEAVGGNPELTTPLAVPMTLISGAIDIHDDIIDESKSKDGRPTVYGKFGKNIALLVGDALLFKGFALLYEAPKKGVPGQLMPTIISIIKETFFELGDAEALELSFRGRIDVSPQEYIHVIRKKAADVEAHTRISAILGGGSREEVENLGKYGRLLGMLLILRDDWIDMLDPKENQRRIRKECLPLPILYALQDSKIKSQLTFILQKERIAKKDAEKLSAMIEKTDALEKVWKLMHGISEDAIWNLREIKTNINNLTLLVRSIVPSEFRNQRDLEPPTNSGEHFTS